MPGLKQKAWKRGSKILPRLMHKWYLEATKNLNPDSYNPNAQKSYDELTVDQRYIDRFIAKKTLLWFLTELDRTIAEGKRLPITKCWTDENDESPHIRKSGDCGDYVKDQVDREAVLNLLDSERKTGKTANSKGKGHRSGKLASPKIAGKGMEFTK